MEFSFDPDELLSEEIIVDKLDAARRQMESAIAMFSMRETWCRSTPSSWLHTAFSTLSLASEVSQDRSRTPRLSDRRRAAS